MAVISTHSESSCMVQQQQSSCCTVKTGMLAALPPPAVIIAVQEGEWVAALLPSPANGQGIAILTPRITAISTPPKSIIQPTLAAWQSLVFLCHGTGHLHRGCNAPSFQADEPLDSDDAEAPSTSTLCQCLVQWQTPGSSPPLC